MEYRLLGPLEVESGGCLLNLGGGKQRALLALLLLNANRVVSVDRIIGELWGDEPPDTAANATQVYVAALRKILDPGRSGEGARTVLVTRSPGYLMQVDPDGVDVLRFERLVDEAREALASDPERASARLRQALALRRGPTLEDVTFQGAARGAVTRFDELHLSALEDRIQADIQLGRHASLVGELGAMVAAHPLRERLRAQLMLALYRCGRQADALKAYQDARHMLAEELGIDPGAELQNLEKGILRQDPSLSWSDPGTRAGPSLPATPSRVVRPASGSMVFLEVVGPGGAQVCPLDGSRVAIGREAGNDIVLDADDQASRIHAVLDRIGPGWSITDLGSRNGTHVNGVRITGQRALQHGDELLIGATRVTYRVSRPGAAEPRATLGPTSAPPEP